jgi:hypothetical protein
MKLVYRILTAVIAACLFLFACYSAHFVQDDWAHLYNVYENKPSQVLNYFNLWQTDNPDPLHFYRPLPTKLYFYLMYTIFGLNKLFYLTVNTLIFCLNALLVYRLFFYLSKKNEAVTNTAYLLYLFSILHFTSFSYVTKIEDLLFSMFAFVAVLGWIEGKRLISVLGLVLALVCRESALVIPIALVLYELLYNKRAQTSSLTSGFFRPIASRLWPHISIVLIYAGSRTFWYGWPSDGSVYHIELGIHVIRNLIKYLQWNLNISGLIKGSSVINIVALCLALCMLGLLVWAALRRLKTMKVQKPDLFALLWWLLFLSPVLFFRDHIDPWNLLVAALGLMLLISLWIITLPRQFAFIFIGTYLTGLCLGLWFYSDNHWTKQRSFLVAQTYAQIKQECHKPSISMPSLGGIDPKELQYSWYYQSGPRLVCNNKQLIVIYP